MGSPTITASLPLASTPTALQVGNCDASSNTTISKASRFESKYCATEMGLISIHGDNRGKRFEISSNNLRILVPLPPLLIILWSIPSSELCAAATTKSGTLLAKRQYISFLDNSVSSVSIRLNCSIFSLNTAPEKEFNAELLSIAIPQRA